MTNNIKALKSGIWYTISNFLVHSVDIITMPIFTRLLTKEQFGLYNNYMSWRNILTIVITMDLGATLTRARFDFKRNFDEYILSILSLSTLSATVWFILFAVFRKKVEELLGVDYVYINAMLLYMVFLPAVSYFQGRERNLFKYKRTIATSMFITISTSLLSLIMVTLMKNKLGGWIWGSIIPTVAVGAVFFVLFIERGKRIDPSYWGYALTICLPYIPHLLSMNVLNSTDRVMIRKWCGAEDTALYSLAYSCCTIVTLLTSSINSAYAPWLGEQLYEKHYSEIRRFSKYYISGFAYLAIGIMLLAPEVLLILGGKNYLEARYVMPPVAMGCICQFLYTMFVNVEQFMKKTVGMAIASASAALLNVILNWLLIPRFGYIAAAYTTLIGYLWLLVVHMFLVYRIGLAKVYNYKFVGFMAMGLCLPMIGMHFLYANSILRYIVVAVYIVLMLTVGWKERINIQTMLKRLRG